MNNRKLFVICLAAIIVVFGIAGTAFAESEDDPTYCNVIVTVDECGYTDPEAGMFHVQKGSEFELELVPASGYAVASVVVNGEDKIGEVKDGYVKIVIERDTQIDITHAQVRASWALPVAIVVLLLFWGGNLIINKIRK